MLSKSAKSRTDVSKRRQFRLPVLLKIAVKMIGVRPRKTKFEWMLKKGLKPLFVCLKILAASLPVVFNLS